MKIDKFKPKERVEPEPYRRKVWVSVVLTIFGFGLPLIYCGRLKAGILLEIASLITGYLLLSIFLLFPSAYSLIIILVISILIFIAIFIFNIKLIRKSNTEDIPKFRNAWVWIVLVFVSGTIGQELISLSYKSFLIEAYKIPATSMEKTLLLGDYLLADKSISLSDLNHGGLIIFKYPPDPSQNYIKRLIAKAGDRIRIENKKVYLNDQPLDESYVQYHDSRTWPYVEKQNRWGPQNRDNMPEIVVPDGMLFVMGDNRDNSSDSRFWGFVDEELVEGRAMFIHFSWDSENNSVRWDRIGMRLDVNSFADQEETDD